MEDTYKIKDLEQIKLLSDPLKLQLLQAFAESAKTTKQVAAELDESVTKLYRHVDALHDAGLLEIAAEQQKRGTVERTFRAVAQRFEADHSLFADPEQGGPAAARDMLRAGETEILSALAAADTSKGPEAVVVRLRCKATPERMAQLRNSLLEWIRNAQDDDDSVASPGEPLAEAGALIAFYPIDRPKA